MSGDVVVLVKSEKRDPSGIVLDWFVTSSGQYGYIIVTESAEGWKNMEKL